MAALIARLFEPFERFVVLDDLFHLGFDRRKVIFRQRMFKIKVVIEPAIDCWTKCELHSLELPHDGACHDVRTAVPHDVQRVLILLGEDLEIDGLFVGQLESRARRLLPSTSPASAALASPGPMSAATSAMVRAVRIL